MSALMFVLGMWNSRRRLKPRRSRRAPSSAPVLDVSDVEALYRDYAGLVFRRALSFLHNETEAEECMHDIFCKVIERYDQFDGRSSPATWLYQITTRHCLNVIRDSTRHRELIERHIRPWVPTSQHVDHESKQLLEVAWAGFSEELKQVCVYHYIDGLSREEVGRIMGCTGRTIGHRIAEIRATLNRLQGAPA